MIAPAPESPVDATHAPGLVSWLESANQPGIDFPIQNLPFGRFRPKALRDQPEADWRIGVAIGDQVLDLRQGSALCPWPDGIDELLAPLAAGDLATFMAMGPPAWRRLRAALSTALTEGSMQAPFLESCLVPLHLAQMDLPCAVVEYTEFQVGMHTARRIGALFRPGQPVLVNQPWLPVGRHGRASVVRLGDAVRRPRGQVKKAGREPAYLPSRGLDFELELALWVGTGNPLGSRVSMERAEDAVFGLGLLNGWTARDIQPWEGQPLGPFLAKSFATSVSPWVVSLAALAPFRRPVLRPEGDPKPLPHLDSPFNRAFGAFDIRLEVQLQTARMREEHMAPTLLAQANAQDAYWSVAQLLTHHTSNGCNLRTGDLIATGAVSGPLLDQGATLLELTQGGKRPLRLPSGEQRSFLEDGDTVTLRGWCEAPGAVRIGLGQVSATVLPAMAE